MNHPTRRTLILSSAGAALHLALAPRLLARPATRDEDRAALLAACAAGDRAAVREVLDTRPDLVDAADDAGRSAYAVALLAGHDDAGALFVERGFERDLVELALAGELVEVVERAEGDVEALNAVHAVGGSTIWAAARAGRPNLWRLQSARADPNAAPGGTTAVRAAFDCPDPDRAWWTALDLLANGGAANAPQAGGDSILHAAVRRGDARLVRTALRKGADPRAPDAAGETPLALARRLGHAELATLLADEARVPRDHRTSRTARRADGAPFEMPELADVPFERRMAVVGQSHRALAPVRELVGEETRLACALSLQDEFAVEAGAHTGRPDVVRYLLDRGAPYSLPTALMLNELDDARAMLEEDRDRVRERGAHDFPVTAYPIIGRAGTDGLALLLEFGADVDLSSYGSTALHWAALGGDREAAEFLLAHGADPDRVGWRFGRRERTPSGHARDRGDEGMLALLEEHGATR